MYLDYLIKSIRNGQTDISDISNHEVYLKVKHLKAKKPLPFEYISLTEINAFLGCTLKQTINRLRLYQDYRIGRVGKEKNAPLCYRRDILKVLSRRSN